MTGIEVNGRGAAVAPPRPQAVEETTANAPATGPRNTPDRYLIFAKPLMRGAGGAVVSGIPSIPAVGLRIAIWERSGRRPDRLRLDPVRETL